MEKYAQQEGEMPVVPVRVTELSDEELTTNVKEKSQSKNFRSLISPASVGMSISPFVLPSQRSKEGKVVQTKAKPNPTTSHLPLQKNSHNYNTIDAHNRNSLVKSELNTQKTSNKHSFIQKDKRGANNARQPQAVKSLQGSVLDTASKHAKRTTIPTLAENMT